MRLNDLHFNKPHSCWHCQNWALGHRGVMKTAYDWRPFIYHFKSWMQNFHANKCRWVHNVFEIRCFSSPEFKQLQFKSCGCLDHIDIFKCRLFSHTPHRETIHHTSLCKGRTRWTLIGFSFLFMAWWDLKGLSHIKFMLGDIIYWNKRWTSCTLRPDALEVGWRWEPGVGDVFDVQVEKKYTSRGENYAFI